MNDLEMLTEEQLDVMFDCMSEEEKASYLNNVEECIILSKEFIIIISI